VVAHIPRGAFVPVPNVDSSFVQICANGRQGVAPTTAFANFLKAIFAARRKTMLNAVSNALDMSKSDVQALLDTVGVDSGLRPEQISVEQFAKLWQHVSK